MRLCGYGLKITSRTITSPPWPSRVSTLFAGPTLCLRAFSSTSPPTDDVAIIGGGITGLACAYYLTKDLPKARITIYEASDRLGGWLSSTRVPVKDGSVLFEAGPRTLRPTSNGLLSVRLVRTSIGVLCHP